MPTPKENVQAYIDHRKYIYDVVATVMYQSTGLQVHIEKKNNNRPKTPFATLFMDFMNPIGYSTPAGIVEDNGTEYKCEASHYNVSMTVETFREYANAYMGAFRAALRSQQYIEFFGEKNIGLLDESSIDNITSPFNVDFEERARYKLTLDVWITTVDTSEFGYIDKVDITQRTLDCEGNITTEENYLVDASE